MARDTFHAPQIAPAALVHFWASGEGRLPDAVRESVASMPGVVWIGPQLCAVLPIAGDPAVFDASVAVAQSALRASAGSASGPSDDAEAEFSALILPGRVRLGGKESPRQLEVMAESLLEDLEGQSPEVEMGGVYATTRASFRFEIRRRLIEAKTYEGPSGTVIPISRVATDEADDEPWRNPKLFRKRVRFVPRPQVEASLRQFGDRRVVWVSGPVGCGKTRTVHRFLGARNERTIWLTARPGRHAAPNLPTQLGRQVLKGGVFGEADPRLLLKNAGLSSSEVQALAGAATKSRAWADVFGDGDRISRWLLTLADKIPGGTVAVVCDGLEGAEADDLDWLDGLAQIVSSSSTLRLVAIARGASFKPPALAEVPEVRVPPMEPEEMEVFGRAATAGLSLPEEVYEHFLDQTAGHPFAFEEGLTALLIPRLVRQIYGNFFFSGDSDTRFPPCDRLSQHLEAEVLRLDAAQQARMLSLCEDAVPTMELTAASRECEGEIARAASGNARVESAVDRGAESLADESKQVEGDRWFERLQQAGLVRLRSSPWGEGVAFRCPAYVDALRADVPFSEAQRQQRTLGKHLLGLLPKGSWPIYKLLEGSRAAVEALLAAAREGNVQDWRLLTALETELAQHRSFGGDDRVELELLWYLLPLARRLDQLESYRSELTRALQLAEDTEGESRKVLAFGGLLSELEEEAGRLGEAETALRSVLKGSAGSGESAQALLVLRLGRLLIRQGRLTEAQDLLERVIPALDEAGAVSLATSGRFYLGNIALHQHRIEQAIEIHLEVLEVRRRQGRPKPIGQSLSALGSASLMFGHYTKATAYFREAEEVFSTIGDEEEASFALLGIGRALSRVGDFLGARPILRRALEQRERTGDPVGEAIARLAVAENDLDLEHPKSALVGARQSHFNLSLKAGGGVKADSEQLLGRILLVQRSLDEAEEHLELALEGHQTSRADEAAAIDRSLLLKVALIRDDEAKIADLAQALERDLSRAGAVERREILEYRLYSGLDRLGADNEAQAYLERAYGELLRKTENLPVGLRHRYLFQIREHEAIVRIATRRGLALPEM